MIAYGDEVVAHRRPRSCGARPRRGHAASGWQIDNRAASMIKFEIGRPADERLNDGT